MWKVVNIDNLAEEKYNEIETTLDKESPLFKVHDNEIWYFSENEESLSKLLNLNLKNISYPFTEDIDDYTSCDDCSINLDNIGINIGIEVPINYIKNHFSEYEKRLYDSDMEDLYKIVGEVLPKAFEEQIPEIIKTMSKGKNIFR